MKNKHLLAAVLLALLIAATTHAAGPPYVIIDLGPLPVPGASGAVIDIANHINNFGQVTGSFVIGGSYRGAYVYSNGAVKNLGSLPGGGSNAGFGINNLGQVTGWAFPQNGYPNEHPFLYSGGIMQDLGLLPNSGYGDGYAINDAGQVTGQSGHAFLASGGTMVDLGTLNGNPTFYSQGNGINASGQVTGWSDSPAGRRAILSSSSPGSMSGLGTFGGDSSEGHGINDSGQVTGWADLPGGGTYDKRHAFLRNTPGGTMGDLGTLPGDTFSHGNAINNPGQVVGSSGTFVTAEHAFLYSGGTMYNLNSLATNLATSGFHYLAVAYGINDQGWIVGQGIGGSSNAHAFLAIPTTPPEVRIVTGGSGFEVRWPANANEWTLQTSTTLATGSWTAVPGPFATDLGEFVYSFPHSEPRRFFRLFVILVAGP